MRDSEIRTSLDARLRHVYRLDNDTLIRHELGLGEGARRIDVAAVNGHLSGWEIKSDVDTLNRLAGQAEMYGRVFDYLTIVTTRRYIDKAAAQLPTWWGLMMASEQNGDIKLRVIRPPKINRQTDAMASAQLLWRDEALSVLKARGLERGLSGKARWYVWERLASSLSKRDLRSVVRHQLKVRQNWSGGQLLPANDG